MYQQNKGSILPIEASTSPLWFREESDDMLSIDCEELAAISRNTDFSCGDMLKYG